MRRVGLSSAALRCQRGGRCEDMLRRCVLIYRPSGNDLDKGTTDHRPPTTERVRSSVVGGLSSIVHRQGATGMRVITFLLCLLLILTACDAPGPATGEQPAPPQTSVQALV